MNKLIRRLLPEYFKKKLRLYLIRRKFPTSVIYNHAIVGNDVILGHYAVIFPKVEVAIKTSVGNYSYIQSNSVLWNTEVGKFCSIARNVTIGLAAHPKHMVSTSPIFYDDQVPLPKFFVKGVHFFDSLPRTTIGNDVWIGEGVRIKAGISVGDSAIIGAGSIVTADIPDYAIAVGVPARVIGFRFNADIRKQLSRIQWWNMTDRELMAVAEFFGDPSSLISQIETMSKS